jgi:hypothetical protein
VSSVDYTKGTVDSIMNDLEKNPLYKEVGDYKNFVKELVIYGLMKKNSGEEQINKTLRSEIFAKVIETNAEILAGNKNKTTYEFFKDLIAKLYESIVNTLGFSTISTSELNSIDINEFSQKVIAEVLGERLSTSTKVRNQEEFEVGGKKKKKSVESLTEDENEYESVQSTFGDSSMDDLIAENEQEKKEEQANEAQSVEATEEVAPEKEKKQPTEEEIKVSNIKLDASKLFVQVLNIATDVIESFTDKITKAKGVLDKLLNEASPEMDIEERDKIQSKIQAAEKGIRHLENKQKLSDILNNIKKIVTDNGILEEYNSDPNIPDNEKSFQAYLHKLLAGDITLSEAQRKLLGTAQRGPLGELYKYHADAVSNQEKIDDINAEIKDIVNDSKIVKQEKAVKWANVPKEVKSKFASEKEYKEYLNKKADNLEQRRVDLKEELTNLEAEKVTPQNIFDAVIANEKKIKKDLSTGQERSHKTSEQRFQQKLKDKAEDVFAELDSIEKSIRQINKEIKEIDDLLSVENIAKQEQNRLEAKKLKLNSDKIKLAETKKSIVDKFSQLSIGINQISPNSYKIFLESDNGKMMQLMPGAFFPNKPYLHFTGTTTDGQGNLTSTYNYKTENGATKATVSVTMDIVNGTGTINFIAKDKLSGDSKSTKDAFIAATKLIQSFGLSPRISNYINGYGFELMERLVTDGILVRNNLVDRIGAEQNNIKQQYYLLQPFQYNQDTMFELSVFHGSPYDFNKFSTKHIGTGEGNQSYGWGLYFTNKKQIALNYAEKLSKEKYDNYLTIGDKKFDKNEYLSEETDGLYFLNMLQYNGSLLLGDIDSVKSKVRHIYDYYNQYLSDPNVVSNFENDLKKYNETRVNKFKGDNESILKQVYNTAIEEINELFKGNEDKQIDRLSGESKGVLYKTTLHKGKTPEQYDYIRWDKVLTPEQVNKVKKGLVNIGANLGAYNIDNITGKDLYRLLHYNVLKSQKDTSLFLLENNIDGIQYPSKFISGKTNENDFNYVVFNENAIEVENKEQLIKDEDEDEFQFSINLNSNATPTQAPVLTSNQINAIQAIANQYQNINQFQSPNFQPYQSQNRSWIARNFGRLLSRFGVSKVITEDYMVAKEQNISGYQAKMRAEMAKDRAKLQALALSTDFKSEPLFRNCSNEGIIELLDMALAGDMMIMNALPSEIQTLTKTLRNKIDAITDDVIRSGYTNAMTSQIMEENKSKYLTRSFYKYIMKPSKLQSFKKKIFGTSTAWDKYIDNLKKTKPEVIDRALSGFFVYAMDGKISEKSKTNDPNFKTLAQRWDMVSSNFATIDAMRKKLATITTQLETEKNPTERKRLFAEREAVSLKVIAEAEAQTDADVVKLVEDTKKFSEMALEDLWSQEDPSKHKIDLGGYLPGQVQNVNLSRRKEEDSFPEWMRDAIGEVQDPTINFAQTVNNLTKLDSRIKFLNQIYNLGKKDGFIIRAADVEYDAAKKKDLEKEGWILINGINRQDPTKNSGSPQSLYGPFIGTYIHPDLHRFAFGEEGEISGIYMLRGLVLAGKTIGNVILGPERNLAGNLGMLLMNGTFTKMATNFFYDGSINQETKYIKSLKGKNFADKYVAYWKGIVDDAERLGVVTNVHSGAVVEIFKQMSKEPSLMKAFEDEAATGWTSLYKKMLTVPNTFAKWNTAAYIWADIIPKVYAFNVERNTLAADYSTFENKMTGAVAKKLTFGSLVSMKNDAMAAKNIAEVERLTRVINNLSELAASHTNQTMVSSERIMPLVENLNKTSFKKSPGKAFVKAVFGGDFVRFKAETTRIFVQTIGSILGAKKQFKSKENKGVVDLFNSKLMNDAFAANINNKQRIHSLGGFIVWSNAYAQVISMYAAFGASLLAMIGIGGGDDDEDEYIETDPSKSYKTIKQSAEGSGMFDKNSNFGKELERIYMGSSNGSISVDEAVREYSNDYMRLHQLGFNLMGNGRFEVKDKGTIDPFSSQMAFLRGFVYNPKRGWANKLSGYVGSMYSEQVGTEMIVNNVLSLLNNKDQYGNKIYNEKEDVLSQIGQGSLFAIKGLSPAVLSTFIRVNKAVEGTTNDKGEVIKEPVSLGKQLLQENINAFTGRSYYVDVKQKLATFIREEAGDSEQGLNAQIYGEKSEQGLKTIVYNLNRKVEAARVLGVSDDEIVNIISRSVLGRKPEIANAVYQGGSYIDNLKVKD